MQSLRHSTSSAPPSARPHKFKVVVAFDDDAASSTSAMKACDFVVQQLGDIPVRRRLVNIHETRTPRSRTAAARDAARADMVIVSTQDGAALSGEMQKWLDECAAKRSVDEGALVAVLSRAPLANAGSGVRHQLARMARQMHMDFISSE